MSLFKKIKEALKDPKPLGINDLSVADGSMPETAHLLRERQLKDISFDHTPPPPEPPPPRLLREGKLPEPPPSQIIKEGQDPRLVLFPPEKVEELQKRINIHHCTINNNNNKTKKMRLLLTKAFVEKLETISINLTQSINLNIALEDSAKDPDFHRAVPKDQSKKLIKLNKQLKRAVKRLRTQGRFK